MHHFKESSRFVLKKKAPYTSIQRRKYKNDLLEPCTKTFSTNLQSIFNVHFNILKTFFHFPRRISQSHHDLEKPTLEYHYLSFQLEHLESKFIIHFL